jgi:hypothetical protein
VLDAMRLFHVGIAVVDLDAAMSDLGRDDGPRWAPVRHVQLEVWRPGEGFCTFAVSATYSIEGPTHIELLSGPAGSSWDPAGPIGPHHFGYWSSDVATDTERLIGAGWALIHSVARPADGYGRHSYVRSPGGRVAEIVDEVLVRPKIERWLAGDAHPDRGD